MVQQFDKDVEILKINLLADELRASHFTRIGFWISLYVTIVAGTYALLGLTDRTEVTAFVFLFFMGILYIYWQIRGDRSEYDEKLAKLGSLIKSVEAGKTIGDFNELFNKLRE